MIKQVGRGHSLEYEMKKQGQRRDPTSGHWISQVELRMRYEVENRV